MKNTPDTTDEVLSAIAEIEDEGNADCRVRRKIEDHLERRRYLDELGEEEKK